MSTLSTLMRREQAGQAVALLQVLGADPKPQMECWTAALDPKLEEELGIVEVITSMNPDTHMNYVQRLRDEGKKEGKKEGIDESVLKGQVQSWLAALSTLNPAMAKEREPLFRSAKSSEEFRVVQKLLEQELKAILR